MLSTIAILCAYVGTMAVGTPAQPKQPTEKLDLYAIEQHVIARTNAERIKAGLNPLLIDQELIVSARRQAAWMSRNSIMQHGSAPVAENIAAGQRSPKEVLNSWMNSSGHRANILNPSHTKIGVAAFAQPNGQIYWCQQFTN
jgi:uncharacterized protein YkwD